MKKILIVDDDRSVRFGVRDFFATRGYEVAEAGTCAAAVESFGATRFDAAIVDHRLPDGDALALLPRLKEIDGGVPLVVLTAHASIDLAVQAVKLGAEQFLTKPIELPALAVVLERVLDNQRNRRSRIAGRAKDVRDAVDPFLGTSRAIRDLAEQAEMVRAAESPVLILGETGAGKGILARWLHDHGSRSEEPFVDLNCAGLSREFLETELFGHEKGAFTGAVAAKIGLLEVAQGGTVFLDEIGDMDLQVQPKLLKALEEKRFRRLGDVRERRVDIKLIAATHQDLASRVRDGKFRSDLYYRVSAIPLVVPPLRERPEDVPLLARHLLARSAGALGHRRIELATDADQALRAYPWPGNLRELRNVLERAVLLGTRDVLGRRDLRFDDLPGPSASAAESMLTLAEIERRHIERVLHGAEGRVEEAATRLGIPRSTLYEKIRRHGIDVPRSSS